MTEHLVQYKDMVWKLKNDESLSYFSILAANAVPPYLQTCLLR